MAAVNSARRVYVDYETDGLKPQDGSRPFIVGLSDETGHKTRARPGTPEWRKAVDIIEDPTIEKVAHGAKFELKHSWHMGMKPAGRWHDTMAKAVLVDEYSRLGLEHLAPRYLGMTDKGVVKEWLDKNGRAIKKDTGREPNYADVPAWLLEKYLDGDLDKTRGLDQHPTLRAVETRHADLYRMETELAYDIAEMEDMGLRIDLPFVEKTIKELKPRQAQVYQEMADMIGAHFNPGSRFDLSMALDAMGIDTGVRDDDGIMKTGWELMELLPEHPFLEKLSLWRALQKVCGTYFEPFLQSAYGDMIHGSIWQYGRDKGIVTGRMSSTDPNLQNLPGGGRGKVKKHRALGIMVRHAIIAPPGHSLLFFDFKQIEMVIFSCLTKDKNIINDIRNGMDVYVAHGKIILGDHAFDGLDKDAFKNKRFEAKELCLSFCYGMGLRRFANRVKLPMAEARQRREAYFARSPAARDFILHTTRDILINGFAQDVFGRRYHVPRELAYKGVNALCQGPAATVMKRGLIKSRALKAFGVRRLFPLHDELVCTVPTENLEKAARAGIECMADRTTFPVPIEVDAAYSHTNWAAKQDFKWK